MKPLTAPEIRGTWGTLLLPIAKDDAIDWTRLTDEIAAMAATGINGIYSNGSAGEFYAQTEAEFDRVSALLAAECERHALPFQIGACHMSPQISLERLRRAVQLRPSAVQVVLPDWFAPTLDEAVAFLDRMVQAAAPVGVVVYNPPHAKKGLTAADWAEVTRRVPGIVGMKVAGGDAAWYAQMAPILARYSVFVAGHALATGKSRGASGAYSNVACLSPRGAARWFALMESDPEQALAWERKIQGFIKTHIVPLITEQGYSNSAVDKLLAAIGGWADIGTRLRWPYRWIPDEEVRRLRGVARAELPELLEAR